jgi:hypothetical protein
MSWFGTAIKLVRLKQLMGSQSSPLDKWIPNGNTYINPSPLDNWIPNGNPKIDMSQL